MAAAHVQSGSSGANGSTTPSHTLAGAPTQGNLLVAAVVTGNQTTQTEANGYTQVPASSTKGGYYYKIADSSEPAAQAPCTLSGNSDWRCAVVEYSGIATGVPLDASGAQDDATSPQDSPAVNPTDDIDTLMVAIATNDANRTYSGQTIGGSAATERVDAQQNGNASITLFDRLNVNTSTSTFVAQATASGTPSNGRIGLLIFKLRPLSSAAGSQPTATGVLARIAKKVRALAGIQPSATGVLARQLDALRTVDGSQEAPSGTLEAVLAGFTATLAGAQAAATGTLAAVWVSVRLAAGSQPTATGVLARGLYTGNRVLEGIQAAATGALEVLAPTANMSGTATLTETLRDTATLSEAIRDTATLTVTPVGG